MGSEPNGAGVSRRGFLTGVLAGAAGGAALTWLGVRTADLFRDDPRARRLFAGRRVEIDRPDNAMPGPYPGQVVEVHHPGSVSDRNIIDADAVRLMMDQGMCELTGADDATGAWRRFFEKDDVVGIKVNPVGRKPLVSGPWGFRSHEWGRVHNAVGAISSPEVLIEVVRGLKSAGVKPKNIIVFERYANEFRDAGYEDVMRTRPLDGCRWYASSSGYDATQLSIDGFASGRDKPDPHVVGYDPDVFVSMGFAAPDHDHKDDRRFRSHLSVIITRMVNKFVTLPVLKDHRSAGVTLALKNLSHGLNNNVARSHIAKPYGSTLTATETLEGPNQCNTFIPTAVGQQPTRQKATLHILDGLIGVYEGGPGCWNKSWGTWRHKSLFFATDPVALDHVGWDVIDAKRVLEGLPPVAHMGLLTDVPPEMFSPRLAALAALGAGGSVAAAAGQQELRQRLRDGRGSENFNVRQPDHVILAGHLGLGTFDARQINYRRLVLPA
jgi:hypothetical protein